MLVYLGYFLFGVLSEAESYVLFYEFFLGGGAWGVCQEIGVSVNKLNFNFTIAWTV